MRDHLDNWNLSSQASATQEVLCLLGGGRNVSSSMCTLKEFAQVVKYLKETPKYRLLVKQKHWSPFSFSCKLLVYRVLCIRDAGAWRHQSSLCHRSRGWRQNGCLARPESGGSEDNWIDKSQFYQLGCQKNLELAAEGRVAEAPDGEAVSGDVHKMPCGLCRISSVSWDVFPAWNNV